MRVPSDIVSPYGPVRLVLPTQGSSLSVFPDLGAWFAAVAPVPKPGLALWFRERELPLDVRRTVGADLARRCGERAVAFWWSGNGAEADGIPIDAVLVPESGGALPNAASRGGIPWGRAVHDERGADRARTEGADLVVIAPIREVPGKGPPLGWPAFAWLTDRAGCASVALGGLRPGDGPVARDHGASAIALLRAAQLAERPSDVVDEALSASGRWA